MVYIYSAEKDNTVTYLRLRNTQENARIRSDLELLGYTITLVDAVDTRVDMRSQDQIDLAVKLINLVV